MDTLALLCNLHADGPATLHRLRRVGCESLASLLRLEPSALAAELDWNDRLAERFLREAALLAQRLDERPRGGPELEQDDPALASSYDDEVDEEEAAELENGSDDEESEEGDGVEHGFAPPSERVEALLGAWRELDRVAPPPEPVPFVIPRPTDQATLPDLRLAQASLPGLSSELRGRLEELGITTLRGFVAGRDIELARTLHLGFTRLKHLQFLASKELERLPPITAREREPSPERGFGSASDFETRAVAALEPYAPPPADPFETAGPFA